ncbi:MULTISPECIES: ABC transporter substrate-binding protein [Bacteria]
MRKSHLSALAAIAAAGLMLAGCSSGNLSGESAAPSDDTMSEELIPITVGLLQIAPAAAVQLAIDEGIFEEHGLDVTIQLGQGGAALLPAVSSGSIQFAVGNPLSVLVAASQGLEMQIVAGYSHQDLGVPASGLVVRSDSGIASWKDLEGKTVAVNAVNTLGDLGTMGLVEQDGGDPEAVQFTEIAFPDQLAQLEQGNIDAAWIPEPFISGALAMEGMEYLGNTFDVIPGLYSTVTFTSAAYAEANPEIVKAFAAGIADATAFAMENDDLNREAIVAYTGMPAEVVGDLELEVLSGDLDRGILEELTALALSYGFLESEPDLDAVIAVP